MKKGKVIIGIIIAAIVALAAWRLFFPNILAENAAPEDVSKGTVSMNEGGNILVAYFSLTGNRIYTTEVDAVTSASLNIQDGEVLGNAEILARAAKETTRGDIFFIEVSEKYPESFDGTSERSSTEQGQDARPELATHVENMEQYTTIILVSPTWWGALPQAVLTFLEEYDFSGKTIIPIATSQGSGLGTGPRQITAACPDAIVEDGLSSNDVSDVTEFLQDMGLAQQ